MYAREEWLSSRVHHGLSLLYTFGKLGSMVVGWLIGGESLPWTLECCHEGFTGGEIPYHVRSYWGTYIEKKIT